MNQEQQNNEFWILVQLAKTNKHGHFYPELAAEGPEIQEPTKVIRYSFHKAALDENEKLKSEIKLLRENLEKIAYYHCYECEAVTIAEKCLKASQERCKL